MDAYWLKLNNILCLITYKMDNEAKGKTTKQNLNKSKSQD